MLPFFKKSCSSVEDIIFSNRNGTNNWHGNLWIGLAIKTGLVILFLFFFKYVDVYIKLHYYVFIDVRQRLDSVEDDGPSTTKLENKPFNCWVNLQWENISLLLITTPTK